MSIVRSVIWLEIELNLDRVWYFARLNEEFVPNKPVVYLFLMLMLSAVQVIHIHGPASRWHDSNAAIPWWVYPNKFYVIIPILSTLLVLSVADALWRLIGAWHAYQNNLIVKLLRSINLLTIFNILLSLLDYCHSPTVWYGPVDLTPRHDGCFQKCLSRCCSSQEWNWIQNISPSMSICCPTLPASSRHGGRYLPCQAWRILNGLLMTSFPIRYSL